MIDLSIITRHMFRELKVKSTKEFVEDCILSHPERSTLLAIADTMDLYHIENMALKIDNSKLQSLPLPCIIQDKSLHFFILKKYSSEKIICLSDKGKKIEFTETNFLERWTGICLLAEANKDSVEPGIEKKINNRRSSILLASTVFILLISWGIFSMGESIMFSTSPFFVIFYTLLKSVGILIGVLLLWYEIDKHNPSLQSFCSGGSKIDCESVLESKHAKLFKGGPSLSLLVFSYFFGSLIFLIILNFSLSSFSLLAFLSISTTPIILLSLFYQAIVIKKWCKFCLIVEAILVLEIIISFLIVLDTYFIELKTISLLLGLLMMPLIVWTPIRDLIDMGKEGRSHKRNLIRFKANPDVLNGILSKNQKLTKSTKGLGISLSGTNAKHKLIKVCHPYCDPCSKAHPILETLWEEGKIDLQIIFSIGNNQNDIQTKLVKHFLAMDENSSSEIQKALGYWYSLEKKDFETFIKMFPINGELGKQEHKIDAMHEWCEAENLHHTPTIFINGYKLPEEYGIEDLANIL